MKRVLVVDDERRGRRVLQIALEQMGIESVAAESGDAALHCLETEKVDLVLSDLAMPGMNGLELLRRIRDSEPDVPVILLTAYATVQSAVEAMKLGAFDYLIRPFDVDVVEAAVRRALEFGTYRRENSFLREQVRSVTDARDLIFASAAMEQVSSLIDRVAQTRSAVLVTGETGTGKELVARAIHERSARAARLFVPLNCAAIPADLLESELFGHARGAFTGATTARTGKFEIADGGTLFLDEIGEMPATLQAKLLRVLQDEVVEPVGSNRRVKIDVRIVSATNRDLNADMASGHFRADLFYRLNVLPIHIPPLRDRVEDIAPLLTSFLTKLAREMGRTPPHVHADALAVLQQYPWPGNVRELRNTLERAVVLCNSGAIDAAFVRHLLPATPAATSPAEEPHAEDDFQLEPAVARLEKKLMLRALGATGDNKVHAARLLGISERTLWYKLRKYDL